MAVGIPKGESVENKIEEGGYLEGGLSCSPMVFMGSPVLGWCSSGAILELPLGSTHSGISEPPTPLMRLVATRVCFCVTGFACWLFRWVAGLMGSVFDERWQPLGGHLRELCGNLWRTANLWGTSVPLGRSGGSPSGGPLLGNLELPGGRRGSCGPLGAGAGEV